MISAGASHPVPGSTRRPTTPLARDFATTGWLSDNISSLSSGGFDETGGTVDLVAPGDLSFASCSTDTRDLLPSAPTSRASRPTSRRAAAPASPRRSSRAPRRWSSRPTAKTHGGASPDPGAGQADPDSAPRPTSARPPTEQGAGLLNSYKAVELAESIHTRGRLAAPGRRHRCSCPAPSSTPTGEPGSAQSWPVTITNTGASTPAGAAAPAARFGPDENVQTGSVTLSDTTSPQFAELPGPAEQLRRLPLQRRARAGPAVRLARLAGQPDRTASAGLPDRVNSPGADDPDRPDAASSRRTRCRRAGQLRQRRRADPAAGTWTGVIFGDTAADGGTNGAVPGGSPPSGSPRSARCPRRT